VRGGVCWRLLLSMAKARSWYVESKMFEMLIKGGNSGLRIVERGKNKQGSIFIRRDKISWLVGAVEEVLDVDTSEVYWDPSSAGFPRVLVQSRSNRHGRFFFIEEYEGRKRRGSVLIPEGRYGQGWTKLVSELRIARSALWLGRDFRVSKASQVVSGRSFAEVVGRPKLLEPQLKVVPAASVEENQSRPAIPLTKLDAQRGEPRVTAVAGGCVGNEPAKTSDQAKEKGVMGNGKMASALPKALKDPGKSGMEAPIGGWMSDGNGLASLDEDFNLQVLKTYLSDIRGELASGLKKIENVIHILEVKESVGCGGKAESLGLGDNSSRANQHMVGWSKPKKKAFRQNKIQPGLLGPKPNKKSGQLTQGPGPTSTFSYRVLSRDQLQKLSQAGESSAMGVASATGAFGSTIAGNCSGKLFSGAGVPKPAIMVSFKEAEKDGATNGGVGLGVELSTQRLDTSTEEVRDSGLCSLITEEELQVVRFIGVAAVHYFQRVMKPWVTRICRR
jgi:hypothetical protein